MQIQSSFMFSFICIIVQYAYVSCLTNFDASSHVLNKMSVYNCHSPVSTALQLNDVVNFTTSVSPKLNKGFKEHGTVVLTINITNRFLKELKAAREKSGLTYLDIVNSQIKSFQLLDSERLESRFARNVSEVVCDLKSKFSGGIKRQDYLKRERGIAVFDYELCDVQQMSCSLVSFETKSFELEKRCANLLTTLQNATDENFQLSIENSNAVILQSSLRKKFDSVENKCSILSHENNELQNTINEQLESVSDVSAINHSLKNEVILLENSNTELRHYVAKLEKNVPQPRKQYDEVTPTNRSRILNSLAGEAEKALWFSETFGLTPKSIKFKSKENKDVTVTLNKQRFGQLDSCEKQKLRELIYILDKFSISDAAYHELSMSNDSLPRKYLLVQERNDLNNIFHIERTPGEKPGAFVSIRNEIENFIRQNSSDNSAPLKIKLSGDGAKVSRITSIVTFTLSFPDIDNCVSVKNIKTIAVIMCRETYEEIRMCCEHILKEFNELVENPEIVVDGKSFQVDVVFNGDMKFIQLCLGLCGATGNYACPWCLVNKIERTDLSKAADYYDSSERKRNLSQLKTNADTKTFGSKHKPLVEIEPENIVPDELHLFIRISDVLLQNLMDDCRQLDKKERVTKQKADHTDRLVRAINDCGISFHTWVDASGVAQYTSLTGGDYKKLFTFLPDKLLFVINNKTYDETVFLLTELRKIQENVNTRADSDVLFTRIKKWMECSARRGA